MSLFVRPELSATNNTSSATEVPERHNVITELVPQQIFPLLWPDFTRPGLYFGIAGPLLKQVGKEEVRFKYPIVKFGYTKRPGDRPVEHGVCFGGFEVLDCILSEDAEEVEKDFKTWLGIRMFRGTTGKGRQHTELFRPTSQDDYENCVRHMANLAKKRRESRLQTIEYEKLRADNLRLQIELERLRVTK